MLNWWWWWLWDDPLLFTGTFLITHDGEGMMEEEEKDVGGMLLLVATVLSILLLVRLWRVEVSASCHHISSSSSLKLSVTTANGSTTARGPNASISAANATSVHAAAANVPERAAVTRHTTLVVRQGTKKRVATMTNTTHANGGKKRRSGSDDHHATTTTNSSLTTTSVRISVKTPQQRGGPRSDEHCAFGRGSLGVKEKEHPAAGAMMMTKLKRQSVGGNGAGRVKRNGDIGDRGTGTRRESGKEEKEKEVEEVNDEDDGSLVRLTFLDRYAGNKVVAVGRANSSKPIPFETTLCRGELLLKMRRTDANGSGKGGGGGDNNMKMTAGRYASYFKGRNRNFECQVRIQFKQTPAGTLFFGGDVERKMKLSWFANGLCKMMGTLLRTFMTSCIVGFGKEEKRKREGEGKSPTNGEEEANQGDMGKKAKQQDRSEEEDIVVLERPVIALPLTKAVDRLIVTPATTTIKHNDEEKGRAGQPLEREEEGEREREANDDDKEDTKKKTKEEERTRPPPMGLESFPDSLSLSKKERSGLKYVVGPIYSFSFYSMYIDFDRWKVSNLPGVRPVCLTSFWNTMPMTIVLFEQKSKGEKESGCGNGSSQEGDAEKMYYAAVEIQHLRKTDSSFRPSM